MKLGLPGLKVLASFFYIIHSVTATVYSPVQKFIGLDETFDCPGSMTMSMN